MTGGMLLAMTLPGLVLLLLLLAVVEHVASSTRRRSVRVEQRAGAPVDLEAGTARVTRRTGTSHRAR